MHAEAPGRFIFWFGFFINSRDNVMRCIETLVQDHQFLTRTLGILDAMVAWMEDGRRIEVADARNVLKYLREFGDNYHQAAEESALFPALMRTSAVEETSVRQLLMEHTQERSVVDELERALRLKKGVDFARSSQRLAALLLEHIEKEETLLFPAIERVFTPKDDEMVMAALRVMTRSEIRMDFAYLERQYAPRPRAKAASA
jgi:hemerythrin-like domain-containing protein